MRLIILGRPVTKKNHSRIIVNRRSGRPMLIPSKQAKSWESDAIEQIRRQPPVCRGFWEAASVPLSLSALVYRDRNVGDLGNYLAAICDALERAGVVVNDRLIQSFDGSRLLIDRKNPRVELELTPMSGDPEVAG